MARRKQDLAKSGRPPGFLPFQLVQLVKTPPATPGWLHEIKFDGYRMQVHVEAGRARCFTRNGLDWTEKFPALVADAASLGDCVLDGELCAVGASGYSDFSSLRSAIGRGRTDDLILFTFDLLWDGVTGDLRPYPLETRKAALRKLLDDAGEAARWRFRWVDEFTGAEPRALFQAACEMGFEGIVSKRLGRPYRDGRTGDWLKTKCRPTVEVVIGGWRTEGTRFRSLIAGVWEGGRLRYAGRVHTGYSEAAVRELLPRLEALETDRHAFELGEVPRKTRDIHWARPELVAEIEVAEFTASGKVRQGSYKGLRLDKTAADLREETLS